MLSLESYFYARHRKHAGKLDRYGPSYIRACMYFSVWVTIDDLCFKGLNSRNKMISKTVFKENEARE